jgi:hypothetical protein
LSHDHPELEFIQAAEYGVGRPDGPPLWIIVHDMEASETATRAENTALYFADLPDGRTVSSHYCADSNSVVQCVRLKDRAWTVGNTPGNNRGINWEFAGFASQTREQWLDPFGVAMFDQARPIIRADAAKYGIPLVRRTVAELRAYVPGVTSHNDLRLAFGGTTHTDPGPNFPWDYFMDLINQADDEEAEMRRTLIFRYGDVEGKFPYWSHVEGSGLRVRLTSDADVDFLLADGGPLGSEGVLFPGEQSGVPGYPWPDLAEDPDWNETRINARFGAPLAEPVEE